MLIMYSTAVLFHFTSILLKSLLQMLFSSKKAILNIKCVGYIYFSGGNPDQDDFYITCLLSWSKWRSLVRAWCLALSILGCAPASMLANINRYGNWLEEWLDGWTTRTDGCGLSALLWRICLF